MSAISEFPRTSPESQGLPSKAIWEFVDAVEQEIHDVHTFMLLRHGNVIAEGAWSPYGLQRPHMLFSLSKSFTSTAIGLAVHEGRLSTGDTVISFFPESVPAEISDHLAGLKIHHLLAMCTGHDEDTTPFLHQASDGDWVKAFLAQPLKHEPGTHFLYNTGATFVLSAILQKVTGITLLEYLQPRLLEPLGIRNATWESNPQGIHVGGWGLAINTEDIARFGQLYLQNGRWHGVQLVPETWVKLATSKHISSGSKDDNDWEQGYGYQFWRCRHNAYRGDGAFGQYCIIMPDQDCVLAITGGLGDMQPPLNLIWKHLLPAMSSSPLPPASPEDQKRLGEKLSSLAYLPPQGNTTSPMATKVSGKRYQIDPHPVKFERVQFDFSQPECIFRVWNGFGEQTIHCGSGVWRDGYAALFEHNPKLVASGVWRTEDTFEITIRAYETPFVHTMRFHFEGDQLTMEGVVNVNFGPTEYSLTGHTE